MKFLAAFIMKGRMQATMVAASLALLSLLLPPVSIVSSAAVALYTLRRGWNEGIYVLLFSCLSAALLGFIILGSFQFALLYGLVLWLPIWVMSIILREGKHLAIALEMSVIFGIVFVIGFYLVVSDPPAMWYALLNQMVRPMIENSSDAPVEEIKRSIHFAARFMTGGIAVGTVYSLLFGLFLARWWQSILYNPGGFRAEYLSLRVQKKFALASLILLAIAWFSSGIVSEIGWNIFIIFAVLYTFVGAAILHAAFSTLKNSRFMVPFLYITLILIPHTIIIVMIVGIADAWMDFRSKFSKK